MKFVVNFIAAGLSGTLAHFNSISSEIQERKRSEKRGEKMRKKAQQEPGERK